MEIKLTKEQTENLMEKGFVVTDNYVVVYDKDEEHYQVFNNQQISAFSLHLEN